MTANFKEENDHVEQDKGAPLQSDTEMAQVKRYLLLEIVLKIVDHDLKAISSSKMKLPRLYESMLRAVQDRVLLDLAQLRIVFRKSGIKIYEETYKKDGLFAQYVCRGYHHQFFMLWGFVKAESERVMKQYLPI